MSASPQRPLDLSRKGAHQTQCFSSCSYLKRKPQEEASGSSCPAKGVIGCSERTVRGAVVLPCWGTAGSWQLAWPRGIRDAPTFPAHVVAHAAAGPTRPLLYFFLPCSQASAYCRSRRFGQGPSVHIMQEPMRCQGPQHPLCLLGKATTFQSFSCTCHLRVISRPS